MNEIIGLTREDDACIEAEYLPIYSDSLSGLYVDELQGMSLRIIESVGGSADLWEKMIRAKENAINCFKTDVLHEIMKYKKPTRTRFYGDIGSKAFVRTITPANDYWLRMYSDIRGGKFNLSGLTLILNSTENIDLLIYDDYDLLYTIPVSSISGKPTKTDFATIDLELSGNYYFVIQPTGVPYNNKLTCGCGGYKWCFNPDKPCYKSSRDKWTEWAMMGGGSGDVADRVGAPVQQTGNGMILHGVFSCDVMDILCSEFSDFVNNDIDSSIAWAILYKTGEFLTNYILDSEEVDRYTLLGVESLNENRAYYNTRYAVMVDYIAQNIEDDRNECLSCKGTLDIGKKFHRI